MSISTPHHRGTAFAGSVFEFSKEGPEFLTRMAAEYGEIVRFDVFHFPIYLVSSPELIREVLVTKAKLFPKSDRDIAILAPFLGEGLVTINGQQHKRQRKLAQPAFHTRRINNYAEIMSSYAERIMRDWQPGQQIDMSDEMMELTMFIVCKTLFDADWESMEDVAKRVGLAMEELQEVSDYNFSLPVQLPLWIPTKINRQAKAARAVLDETINRIVQERRAAELNNGPQDTGDLLSMFLMAEYDDKSMMDDNEVRDQLVTLFAAGHETTSNALTWTWYLLSQHPEIEAKLQHELDSVLAGQRPTLADLPNLPYTEMVLKESMRMYPPVWTLNARQASEDITIGEYSIPKGAHVMVSPYVMHRHPDYFSDPMAFDPERFRPENEAQLPKYVYMPFGGGPRVCIGNSFAMMEAQLILATMAQRYSFELDPSQQIELNAQITMSSLHGMKMTIRERMPIVESKQAVVESELPVSEMSGIAAPEIGEIPRPKEPELVLA